MGTDAIEVELTVVERQEKAVLEKFRRKRSEAERRRIYFFETPKLGLYKQGVVLRARETEGEGCDSTVKIRPIDPRKVDNRRREYACRTRARSRRTSGRSCATHPT